MEEKIIQIIPAPANLKLLYFDENNRKEPIANKAICIGLTDLGNVVVMDIDDSGLIYPAEEMENFEGIEWGP